MNIRNILFGLFFILIGFFAEAQVLKNHEAQILEDYTWLLKTAVSSDCNTSEPIKEQDIIETDLMTCEFVEEFKMYPNPSKERINITVEFLAHNSSTQISILNLNGQQVYSENMNDFDGIYNKTIQLDTPAGIYLFYIIQGKETFVRKLVVE